MATTSGSFMPMGFSSSPEMRMPMGKSSPTAARTACAISTTKRRRFSKLPP